MEYNFFAFISYSHKDIKSARKLQSMLEHYNLPASLRKRFPNIPKKFKIFRDKDELTSLELHKQLHKKLDESKYLIVICSPDSAKSEYVADEIAYFRSIGREDKIIPFIVRGVPHSDTEECFNPELIKCNDDILGIDIQNEEAYFKAVKFHKAFIRVVAAMLELDFGVLWNRRKHYLVKHAVAATLAAALVAGLSFSAFTSQPFDAEFKIDTEVKSLPLSSNQTDSLFLYLTDNDVRSLPITSLDSGIVFRNIPGKYSDTKIRLRCNAYGFIDTDTMITLGKNNVIALDRNENTFGHIKYLVLDNDTEGPVTNAVFDFGCIKAVTDNNGILDVVIPLKHQKDVYGVKISHKGSTIHLRYCDNGDEIRAIESDEPQILYVTK